MKRLILSSLLIIALSACGGESTPAAPPESPTVATDASSGGAADTETGPAASAEEESSGSVSDAVIDTSIDTADTLQQTPEELLAAGRVVVGDAGGNEAASAQAVSLVSGIVEVSDFLALHPTWRGVAFDQTDYYSIELRAEGSDERLGWATVDVAGEEVLAYFVPRELTAEEFAAGSALVEAYVFGEALVAEELGDLAAYETETKYRRMEGIWEIHLQQGDEMLVIPVDNWEERYFIDDIYKIVDSASATPNQQAAIDIARTANGVDEALNSRSDWQTYIAQDEETVFAVSFTTPERELFYVKVDTANSEILQAAPGYR